MSIEHAGRARAALWLRVSTTDQTHASQESALRALAEARSVQVVKTYEVKKSAWKGKHADLLDEAVRDARSGLFTHLFIWALDRLDRQGPLSTLQKIKEIEDAGAKVVSLQEPWLEQMPQIRDLMISLTAWVAEWESSRRSERVKARKDELAAQKIWPGGRPPYGYRNDAGQLRTVEAEAETVKLIYRLYTDHRMGVRKIQDELWKRGVSAPKGGRQFSRSHIHNVLHDPTYSGEHRNGVPAPVIIDTELRTRADRRLRDNRHLRPPQAKNHWPLHRMKCGVCGSRFGVDSGGGRVRTYYCRGRQRDSGLYARTGQLCPVPRQVADELEARLLDELRATINSPVHFIAALDTAIARLEGQEQELDRDLAPLIDELEEVEAELKEIERARIRARLFPEELDAMERDAAERQRSLESRIDALGPGRQHELEETRSLLAGARDWRRVAEYRAKTGSNMNAFSFDPDVAESDQLVDFRDRGGVFLDVKGESVQEALGDILDRLHAEAYALEDRVEIRGVIEFDVPFGPADDPVRDSRQVSTPSRGLG